VDALIEKCSTAITEIHRPIYKTQTASRAVITADYGNGHERIGSTFDLDTYDYIREEFEADDSVVIRGQVSSYNNNTYKGRIYVAHEGRPVSFELSEGCRRNSEIGRASCRERVEITGATVTATIEQGTTGEN